MKSTFSRPDNVYNIIELAQKLDKSIYLVSKDIRTKKLIPVYQNKKDKYYNVEQFITIDKYYPIKTTETFYIYESKMNNE